VLGMGVATFGPTLGGLAAHTGSTLAQISIVFTARSFGYMIGSIIGGRLYDRMRGHPVIALGYGAMAVLLVLTPLMTQLPLLVLVLVLLAFFDGIVDVGCNTLLVWAHSGNVGAVMNALHFFFGVGALIAPVLAAQVILSTHDVHWVYWAIALLAIIPAIVHLRTPSPARIQHTPETASETAPSQRENMRLTIIIALFFVAIVAVETGFSDWIASYAIAVDFGDAARAAELTAVFWAGFTAARLLSIPLATKINMRTMLLANLGICGAFTIFMLIFSRTPLALIIGAFGVGFGVAPLFPVMISYAESRMAITGKATSIFLVGSSLGGMTIPFLIGQMFERSGPTTMLWAVLIGTVAATTVFAIVERIKDS